MSRRTLVVAVLALLLPCCAFAGRNLWTGNGPQGGTISALVLDPSDSRTLYAGTGLAGLFRSRDGGASWARTGSESPNFGALAIGASSPNVLYDAGGLGVSRSDDAGAHWTPVKDFSEAFVTIATSGLAVDPTDSNRVFVGVNEITTNGRGTIWQSTDGGASWHTVTIGPFPSPYIGIIAIDPREPHGVFADAGGLVRSLDGGSTWTAASGLTPTVASLAFPLGALGVVVAGTVGGGVFVSRDGGATFVPASSGLSGDALAILGVAPVAGSPSSLFAATRAGLYRTEDLGGTWQKISAGTWFQLLSDPSSASTLYAVNDGVFKSVDGGVHWSEVDDGLVATGVLSISRSSSGTYAAAGGDVFRSSDSGGSWTRSTVLSSGQVNAVLADPRSPAIVYAGTCALSDPVLRSVDFGATWAPFASGIPASCAYDFAAQPGAGGAVFVGTEAGVSRLASGSADWQPVVGLRGAVRALFVDPARSEVVWAGGDSGLFRSDDGGVTWSAALLSQTIFSMASDPSEPHTLYVGTLDSVAGVSEGVLKSTDDGATWRAASAGLPNGGVYGIVVDPASPTTLYAATIEGVFRSVNGALGWQSFNNGIPPEPLFVGRAVQALDLDPANARLYAATNGSGVMSWDFTHDRVLGAAASLHGVGQTYFHSDVAVFNASPTQSAAVSASYFCFAPPCGATPQTFTLAPREARSLPDIAAALFGASDSGGAVGFASDAPITVTSRLFTPSLPAPTTGMFVPGLDPADTAPSQILLLLSHSSSPASGARTNVGVFNPGDEDLDVTFEFHEPAGALLGAFVRRVGAHQALQLNDGEIFAALGLDGDLPSFYAVLEADGVHPLQAYAAVIDNRSQDPFLVRGRDGRVPQAYIAYPRRLATLPAVASLHGRNGAFFQSDVAIWNGSLDSSTVVLRYRCFPGPCGDLEKSLTLGPGEMRLIPDIVNGLFAAPETGGAVELESPQPLVVASRLYTPAHPLPTVGMFVPGLGPGDATATAILTSLAHSANPSTGFRTNIGAFNASDETQMLSIELFDPEGSSLGRIDLTLGPRESRQINDVFQAVGVHADVPSAYAHVRGDGVNPFYAYAAVVDNQSQDPILVPGQSDPAPPSAP